MIHQVQNPSMLVTAVWRQTQKPRKSTPYLILNTVLWTIEKNLVVFMLFSPIVKLAISQPLQNLQVHNTAVFQAPWEGLRDAAASLRADRKGLTAKHRASNSQ